MMYLFIKQKFFKPPSPIKYTKTSIEYFIKVCKKSFYKHFKQMFFETGPSEEYGSVGPCLYTKSLTFKCKIFIIYLIYYMFLKQL